MIYDRIKILNHTKGMEVGIDINNRHTMIKVLKVIKYEKENISNFIVDL